MTPLNLMLYLFHTLKLQLFKNKTTTSMTAAFDTGWPFGKELCIALISTTGWHQLEYHIKRSLYKTVFYMQESDPSALAMLRWKFVVQKYTHPPHRISLPFPNPGIRMDRRRAALLLILIWSYSLAVTCPPLFGWGHTSHHDLVAAHIRFVEYKSK
jgi:c-opsin